MMILQDKIALVAGGSKGIGRGVCKCFAQNGATVVVAARGQRAIDDTVAEITAFGGKAIGIPADCTKKSDVDALVGNIVHEFGRIDILVNNIGGGMPELMVNATDEYFQMMLDINLKATFVVTRAVAPVMIQQKYGKIINTSSIGGKKATSGLSIYDGCKAFIIALTRDLAYELGEYNINVNCICPGHVPTETTDGVGEKLSQITGVDIKQMAMMVMGMMAIKKFATPDDIARLYLFLASRDADFMTGQAINFSSGIEMR